LKEKKKTNLFYNDILNSAEVYDPVTGNWTMTGSMSTSRLWHTETVLRNGKVLIIGGQDESVQDLNNAEMYDPLTRN
jgi:N-acetylneuraminic acid mutarotase